MNKKEIKEWLECNGSYDLKGLDTRFYKEETVINMMLNIIDQCKKLPIPVVSQHVCFAPKRVLPCSHETNGNCEHPGHCNFKDKKQIVA